MLLAIDIGNTHTTFGVFDKDKLRATWRLTTGINRTIDEYANVLLGLLRLRGLDKSDITDVALASVVPPITPTFEQLFKTYLDISTFVIGAGIKTGVRIRMDNPREVGPDRIVNAAAAYHLYAPGPLIIADFGTATTFDVVSKEGDYIGGAISPGIGTMADALFTRTAMLPRVELIPPKRAIGSNTITAMQSGIMLGYVGLIEGIIARIQKELPEKAKVIATGGVAGTGGFSELIKNETSVIDIVNVDLTLIGIMLIHQMNKTRR